MGRIKENNFFLLGISHKTAPVKIREKVAFDSSSCGRVLRDIHTIAGVKECVLLSTCNRTEIFTVITGPYDEVRKSIEDVTLDISGSDRELLNHFYYRSGQQMIEHLFKVSSGLDSMVLGEPQIFGQVKNAYSIACDNRCTGPAINRLFHHAFRVGKLIRNLTAIGEGAVSVSFAAVELARNIFGTLTGRSILLVGAGKTGELCAQGLIDYGVEHLFITNRTARRAKDLAEKLSGEVAPFNRLYQMCEHADIVITSVTSKQPIITKTALLQHFRPHKEKPLFLIDLGVPRNIQPEIAEIDNVFLHNIDDLEDHTLKNINKRKTEAEKAEELILREVDEFCSWLSEREVIPVIRNLHVKCENIRLEELEKVRNRVSPETYETIDLVTRRIVRKILHNPVIAMRAAESGTQRERLLKSIHELFIQDSD